MSRVIQFFNTNPELFQNLPDDRKAEVCILYDRLPTNENRPKPEITFPIEITEPRYRAFKKLVDPQFVPPAISDIEENYTFETEYAKKVIGQQYQSSYYTDLILQDPAYLIHQIMFETHFGKSSINMFLLYKLRVVKTILEYSKKNLWPSDYLTYLTWIGECGIALRCLGYDLDRETKTKLSKLEKAEINIQTSKAILVYELYLSIR